MAGLWLLCLVGVGAVAGSVLPADRTNSPCQPGTVWMAEDGCNTCFCLDSGVPGCSRMECSAISPPADKTASGSFDDVMKPLPLPKPEEEVKPYSTNRDDQKPEPEPLPKPEVKPVEERSGVSCVQGEEWKEDCNSCFCLGDGRAACTKMACSSESRALAEAVKPHCEVGTSWSDDCNVCHCVNDSQVICSYRTCAGAERHRRQTDCTPGTTQQVDCNKCVCLRDGRLGCTLKFCLPESSKQSSQFSSGSVRAGEGSDCVRECPADCGSVRGEDGCLTCQCDMDPFFGVQPLPEKDSAAAAAADSRSYMPYAKPARSSSDCVRECPADCGSVRGEDGCLTCQCDMDPFFGVQPLPEKDSAAAAAADRTSYMPYAKPARSSSDCVRECPADCGSVRGEDGCLTCQCDMDPFFGVRPLPEKDSAAAAAMDRSTYMSYAKPPGSSSDCVRECPADCSSVRGEDGCLTCKCDIDPFFGVQPLPEKDSAAAAAADIGWYKPNAGADNVDAGFAVNQGWMLGGK